MERSLSESPLALAKTALSAADWRIETSNARRPAGHPRTRNSERRVIIPSGIACTSLNTGFARPRAPTSPPAGGRVPTQWARGTGNDNFLARKGLPHRACNARFPVSHASRPPAGRRGGPPHAHNIRQQQDVRKLGMSQTSSVLTSRHVHCKKYPQWSIGEGKETSVCCL